MGEHRARRPRAATVVLAVILAAATAYVAPHWWAQVAGPAPTPVARATLEAARTALPRLAVVEPLELEDYEREFFGPAWADVDGNGCDTRNDVLGTWLADQVRDPLVACVVESGRLHDPYTGHVIDFRRGPATSSAVQVDHVVALADAWRKGGHTWAPGYAQAFANDPANLIPVDGAANLDKGAADAAGWLPPNTGFRCAYVVQQILIKAAYGLGVSATELAALREVLAQRCGAAQADACAGCRRTRITSDQHMSIGGRESTDVPDRRDPGVQRHRSGDRPRVRVPAAAATGREARPCAGSGDHRSDPRARRTPGGRARGRRAGRPP
ncbi:HNH endonuclease family protein [Ruania suaedae]|uniref:HNH endonuclease family protein n=1 Tax=Ruania suaedae TaxID=2897774 RepID=UPI001E53312E|nr:HNH endonuclease family protein [Ruania suaedae]UFU03275.1 HNH endonuclease family protein [Ruania suaedae]